MASVCQVETRRICVSLFGVHDAARSAWHVMVGGMSAGSWSCRADAEEACELIARIEARDGAEAAIAEMDRCAAVDREADAMEDAS